MSVLNVITTKLQRTSIKVLSFSYHTDREHIAVKAVRNGAALQTVCARMASTQRDLDANNPQLTETDDIVRRQWNHSGERAIFEGRRGGGWKLYSDIHVAYGVLRLVHGKGLTCSQCLSWKSVAGCV